MTPEIVAEGHAIRGDQQGRAEPYGGLGPETATCAGGQHPAQAAVGDAVRGDGVTG
ncbi:hypothetical protein [Streptomyces sp. IMTB 2501]|uniref:hypothetical protein n=1 Tax=Streptomyces sp. IMTB 2501 TaxID=1776340 RepID=UPI0015C1028E|nr:hypothetical protein [Streptomyces sp. IMTB 2501]